jgi:hypothetical protein
MEPRPDAGSPASDRCRWIQRTQRYFASTEPRRTNASTLGQDAGFWRALQVHLRAFLAGRSSQPHRPVGD